MDEKFIINGGKPLRGEIEGRRAKNAAFPILAATLLTKKECVISNLPLIEDVFRMIEILKSIGSQVNWIGERTILIKNFQIDPLKIKEDLICLLRGSVLFLGPLLARFGKVRFPQPGGCIIGARPIDIHLDGFRQLGINIKKDFTTKLGLDLKGGSSLIFEANTSKIKKEDLNDYLRIVKKLWKKEN